VDDTSRFLNLISSPSEPFFGPWDALMITGDQIPRLDSVTVNHMAEGVTPGQMIFACTSHHGERDASLFDHPDTPERLLSLSSSPPITTPLSLINTGKIFLDELVGTGAIWDTYTVTTSKFTRSWVCRAQTDSGGVLKAQL
jgi:hypothetical protein